MLPSFARLALQTSGDERGTEQIFADEQQRRRVSFPDSGLPHKTWDQKKCISVPWHLIMYRNEKRRTRYMYHPESDTFTPKTARFTQKLGVPMVYYLIDVLSDDRLGDAAYDAVYEAETNKVASEEVQRYAFEQYARAYGVAGLSGTTPRFVMQIQDVDYTTNGTAGWTRRYCLVLQEDTNLLERLRRAHTHADASISASNIEPADRTKKSIKKIEQLRQWFLAYLEHAIQTEEAKLRRARGGADSGRRNFVSKSNDAQRQRIFAYAGAAFAQ